jgi:hypothetical protein
LPSQSSIFKSGEDAQQATLFVHLDLRVPSPGQVDWLVTLLARAHGVIRGDEVGTQEGNDKIDRFVEKWEAQIA